MTNGQSWVFSLNHSTADNHVNNIIITLCSNMHCTAHVPLRHNMYLVKCTQAYLHRVPFPHMCPTTLPADWAYSSAGSLKSIRGRRCRLGPPPRATIVGGRVGVQELTTRERKGNDQVAYFSDAESALQSVCTIFPKTKHSSVHNFQHLPCAVTVTPVCTVLSVSLLKSPPNTRWLESSLPRLTVSAPFARCPCSCM